jgi:hypothetical protein
LLSWNRLRRAGLLLGRIARLTRLRVLRLWRGGLLLRHARLLLLWLLLLLRCTRLWRCRTSSGL